MRTLFFSCRTGTGDPDMLATIYAEDTFDLTYRLGSITASTLAVGGDRDAFYAAQLPEETAPLLPHRGLMPGKGTGHLGAATSLRLTRDVLAFLARADAPAPGRPGQADE